MTIDLALEKLIPGLQEIYGDLIDSVILYGSTVRGTRTADSDVDVAILLRAGATKVMRDQMLDLVVDLELECGKVLSVLCIDYDKFAEWKDILPFYKNIQRYMQRSCNQKSSHKHKRGGAGDSRHNILQ